jgi:hypothetical protein
VWGREDEGGFIILWMYIGRGSAAGVREESVLRMDAALERVDGCQRLMKARRHVLHRVG